METINEGKGERRERIEGSDCSFTYAYKFNYQQQKGQSVIIPKEYG